jgi:uncharacterized membrane protein YdjX (TVP38/TMEM64 family)
MSERYPAAAPAGAAVSVSFALPASIEPVESGTEDRGARSFAAIVASPRARLALLAALLVLASAGVLLIGGPSKAGIEETIQSTGIAAPVVFVALYGILTVLLFPGSIITAASGVLFGTALGTGLSVIGATIGATGAFLVGRRLGRSQVERIAGRRIGALDSWLERRGFLAVLYVRLLPIVPFNALNYVAGVTSVRPRDYVLGTAIGIIPGAFAYAALGGSLDDPTSPEFLAALGLVVVLAAAGPLLARVLPVAGAPDAGSPDD